MANAPEFGQGEGALTRASGLVSDARADLTQISTRLTDQISSVHSGWGGQGAQAFWTLHRAWTEKQQTITRALDDFAESLTGTERDNLATDDEQGVGFGRLTHRLGETATV